MKWLTWGKHQGRTWHTEGASYTFPVVIFFGASKPWEGVSNYKLCFVDEETDPEKV